MTSGHLSAESALVAAQVGREPRDPWRIVARCRYGYPSVIASPPLLDDGTPFPTFAWLSCPWLVERVGAIESAGEADRWATRVLAEPHLAAALHETDAAVRAARAAEGGGEHACSGVGIAGQRDPLAVKCIHAHVALQLVGLGDPIGADVLARVRSACDDERCASLAACADGR